MRGVWLAPSLLIILIVFFCYKGLYINQHILNSTLIGKNIVDANLLNLSGQRFSIGSIKGPYILNVFASWCPACKYEHGFWHMHSNYKIIGLDYKDSKTDLLKWLKLYGNPYKMILLDPAGEYSMQMGVYGTPETFLIDRFGKIVYRHVGPMSDLVWQNKFLPVLKDK